MRILHTSDWHLGVQLHEASLEEEQQRFLDWLLEQIRERDIHALIVAGDIFHFAQPSNSARKMLYRFLDQAEDIEHLRHILLISGNHDSPSTLETPTPLLDHTRVHVVADARDAVENPGKHLIPLTNDANEVEAVVAAIPYVHSWHLGVRGADMSLKEERNAIADALANLYQRCAEHASDQWPDATRIATGHLTCGKPSADDFTTNVHQLGTDERIGGIEGFGSNIFGDSYNYVALGHIHRAYPVDDHVWYAGTPVATRFVEGETPRSVRLIETKHGGAIDTSAIQVPRWRDLPAFRGSPDDVLQAIADYEHNHELPPYVAIEVTVEDITDSGLRQRCHDGLPEESRIVTFSQRRAGDGFDGEQESEEDMPDLDTVSLEDLFRRLFKERNQNQPPPDEVMSAFYEAQERAGGASQ
jgi:exonuclease SbcD